MSRLDELRHIAWLVGIATSHVDALGTHHEPGEETLSRLIAAFGLPAEPQQAAEMLAEHDRAAPFGLSPVEIVPQETEAPALHLRLPPGAGRVDWRLRQEDGTQHSGRSGSPQLDLPPGLPLGYHRLELTTPETSAEICLAVAPATCHLGPALQPGRRSWGLSAQLYGLRSTGDWGIGDLGHLAELCTRGGAMGAAAIGINPLHASFAAEPRHFSPYSPSSRLWLDYRYIDLAQVPGFAEDAEIRALAPDVSRTAARNAALVDYAAVAALKRPVLEALFRRLQAAEPGSYLAADFAAFCREGGEALTRFAVFEALHEHFTAALGAFSWHDWPAAMRDPVSPAIGEFARAHAERVEFFRFLQWQADRQLAAAAAAGRKAGLSIGLYRDLAVGANPDGAEAWAEPGLMAPQAAIGAPPDALSRAGQNWGLAPLNPLALRRHGFAPLIAALRANMRHAGVLRIDHVMSLQRLYWVPRGEPATAGAYVDYPFRDMLRLVALESRRQGCAVIGEDLGTVPEGFREAMQAANVLSYRVLMFERWDDGNFIPPGDYPPLAVASAATHDLATLKGFWLGRDIEWRRRLAIYPDAAAEETEARERFRDRYQLVEALAREGLLQPERFGEFLSAEGEPSFGEELAELILCYLARSRARLLLVQLEDIAGEAEQANLPGTTDAHPNWRRRLSVRLDELFASPAMTRIAALVTAARARAAGE